MFARAILGLIAALDLAIAVVFAIFTVASEATVLWRIASAIFVLLMLLQSVVLGRAVVTAKKV